MCKVSVAKYPIVKSLFSRWSKHGYGTLVRERELPCLVVTSHFIEISLRQYPTIFQISYEDRTADEGMGFGHRKARCFKLRTHMPKIINEPAISTSGRGIAHFH
ncbi:hypothetical protein D3C80_1312190 [compost metagenome]